MVHSKGSERFSAITLTQIISGCLSEKSFKDIIDLAAMGTKKSQTNEDLSMRFCPIADKAVHVGLVNFMTQHCRVLCAAVNSLCLVDRIAEKYGFEIYPEICPDITNCKSSLGSKKISDSLMSAHQNFTPNRK